jgi:hypothetical protein
MGQVPSMQASVLPQVAQLTSQQAACASACVRPSAETFAASRRAAVPGSQGDWRTRSAQVHGAASRNTAFLMAHVAACVLFWPQASPRVPQAASSSCP